MADKLRLGSEVKELKIGQSFTNPKSSAFHSIKYDFKPASVDINKIATVDVANNHQVTVTVPHLDGAGVQQTVFKGSQRPYTKECVLIIDRATGEITLEKLSSNIQVKKTRSESTKTNNIQQDRSNNNNSNDRGSSGSSATASRPQTPPPMVGQRMSSKTRVTSGGRRKDRQITHMVPKHSPLHASPNYPSPNHHKSPKRDLHVNNETNHNNALASLPSIGDDFSEPILPPQQQQQSSSHIQQQQQQQLLPPMPSIQLSDDGENRVDVMSDTSSSSSDSDSDSDGDMTVVPKSLSNGHATANGITTTTTTTTNVRTSLIPQHILNEDLCLSESGSDSD